MARICIVGARSLALIETAQHVKQVIDELPPDAVIVTRASASLTDTFVARYAQRTGHRIQLFGITGPGREAVFHRDNRMVGEADRVVAFYDPETIGEGGTGHVVEAALRARVPVAAWAVEGGSLRYVGDLDGTDAESS